MNNQEHTIIGAQKLWGGSEGTFGVSRADRRRHLYALGKSGTGKSTLLLNLIQQDIESGAGCALIDPHGDLAQDVLGLVPASRVADVVYFNPTDLEHPPGFNVLEGTQRDRRHLVASQVVSSFRHIWSDSWGPRLEYILYNSLAALLDAGEHTLLSLPRLLTDARFRDHVVGRVEDPMVRRFWVEEFARYEPRFAAEAIAPVQNKVGQFLAAPVIRNILGQVKSTATPGTAMARGQIFIANLAKGKIGEDKANLLGSLLVTSFQLAAMERAEIPEHERKDFYLYVDEFHNFTTDSFAGVLSEARKYRLCLTLANQYLAQMSEPLQAAVFGNVGSLVSFRVGANDASILEREFDHDVAIQQLTGLDAHHVFARLSVDGAPGVPIRGRTLPAPGRRDTRRARVIQRSRDRFTRPRALVEGKINRWLKEK